MFIHISIISANAIMTSLIKAVNLST